MKQFIRKKVISKPEDGTRLGIDVTDGVADGGVNGASEGGVLLQTRTKKPAQGQAFGVG